MRAKRSSIGATKLVVLTFLAILILPALTLQPVKATDSVLNFQTASNADSGNLFITGTNYYPSTTTVYQAYGSGIGLNPGQFFFSGLGTYRVERSWLRFDTSSIPASASLTGATLILFADQVNINEPISFNLQVYACFFGAVPESTANWNCPSSPLFQGSTSFRSSSSALTTYTWPISTSVINRTSFTEFTIISQQDNNQVAPLALENVDFCSHGSIGNPSSCTAANQPTLTITYSLPGQQATTLTGTQVNTATFALGLGRALGLTGQAAQDLGGLILTLAVMASFFTLFAYLGAENLMLYIFTGMAVLGVGTLLGWTPIWFLLTMAILVAGLFAVGVVKWATGSG